MKFFSSPSKPDPKLPTAAEETTPPEIIPCDNSFEGGGCYFFGEFDEDGKPICPSGGCY